MKEWKKPELNELSAQFTQAGGEGGSSDGVMYNAYGVNLIGTSGPELGDPWVPVK